MSGRDFELRGLLRPQTLEMRLQFRAFIATPFGRVPVTGHGALRFTCDGRFHGTMRYNPVITLLAELKGISLVRSLDGTVAIHEPHDCNSGPDVILIGRATIDSLAVSGWVRIAEDSIVFRGATWFDDLAYRGTITSTGREPPLELRFSMYDTPGAPVPVAAAVSSQLGCPGDGDRHKCHRSPGGR